MDNVFYTTGIICGFICSVSYIISASLYFYLEISNDYVSPPYFRITPNTFLHYDKDVKNRDLKIKRFRNYIVNIMAYALLCTIIALILHVIL